MVEIFGSAKALLSPEFVEKVDPEALAAKLIKVEQEYDVKFEKTHSTFNITGQWNSIQAAHNSLLQLKVGSKSNLDSNVKFEYDIVYNSESKLDADGVNKEQIASDSETYANLTQVELVKLSRKSKVKKKTNSSKLKGNPKRGRQPSDKNNTNKVPEPLMIVQFQDQAFSDESCVDMEQVLDEFEKGQVSKGVKKEDIKKLFEKDFEKMGRPPKKVQGFVVPSETNSREHIDKAVEKPFVSKVDDSTFTSKNNDNVQFSTEEVAQSKKHTHTEVEDLTCDVQVMQGHATNIDCHPATGPHVRALNNFQQSESLNTLCRRPPDDIGQTELVECEEESQSYTENVRQCDKISSTEVNSRPREEDKFNEYTEQTQSFLQEQLNGINLKADAIRRVSEKKSEKTEEYKNAVQTDKKLTKTLAKKGKVQRSITTKNKTVRQALKTRKDRNTNGHKINPQENQSLRNEINELGESKGNSEVELHEDSKHQIANLEDKERNNTDISCIYKCGLCDYQGKDKKCLNNHIGRVHGLLSKNSQASKEQTLFSCDECDKTFVFGRDLNRHKKMVHHNNRFVCNICDKVYKSKYVYDKHLEKHSEGYVQRMFKCQLCSREFTTKFTLGIHTKSEHLGVQKTFICPTCGKSFKQIRSYRQHANVHAGIRPYVCEICGKSFSYDKSLKEHRYMHDEIKRFPCTICDKAFRQRTCLLIHMKTHTNAKDHICSSCGKGFSQRQSLIRHERSHSGHKPYTCKLCSKSFTDYAVIRKHLLLSHKQNKTVWKEHVITEKREMSDHYISGGPGYVRRDSCEKIQGKLYEKDQPPSSTRLADYALAKINAENRKDDIKLSQVFNRELAIEVPTKLSSDTIDNKQITYHAYPKMNSIEMQYTENNQHYTTCNQGGGLFIQHDSLSTLHNLKDARYVLSNSNQIHFVNSNNEPQSNIQLYKSLPNAHSDDASRNAAVQTLSSADITREVTGHNQIDQCTMTSVSDYQPLLQYIGSTGAPVNQLPHMEFWARSYTKQK